MKRRSDIKRFGAFVKRVVMASVGLGIVLFATYWILVSQSDQNPMKEQTKETSRMIFGMFYTAMQNGWGQHEIDTMTNRINQENKNLQVKLYRGPISGCFIRKAQQST